MPKIRISEQRVQSESSDFIVKVSFDETDEFENLTVQNPLSPQNRAKLEWHFEQFVSYPYLKEVEPAEAQKIIREEGENLFSQLFDKAEIYNRYRQAIQNGLSSLVIEISGSPEFHSLHWEALKDPRFPNPLSLETLILRKDLKPQNLSADVRETSIINLLIVTSRPAGRRDVGYRTISRPLIELLRNSQLPVKVHILRPATYESLDKHLDTVGKGFYHVVHFDVHGALLTFENFEQIEKEKTGNNLTFQISRYGRPEIQNYEGRDAFLFFDLYVEPEAKDDDGFRADPVRADELANLLLMHGIPLVILNACQSAKELGEQEKKSDLPIAEETSLASRLMRAGAQMVLAMSYSVTVTAAEILMKSLYQEIFRRKTVHQAIQIGRRELERRKLRRAAFNYEIPLEDWLLPVVYQKQNVELKTKALTPQEEEEFLLAREEINRMPEVEYGFHGRDIDILNIERRVLLKNNILLIRGMGGAGKTTLLRHLAWWWRATNFVKKVFYFGYDEKAYTRQEIMFRIAENLYDRFEFASFQAMDERAQIQKLAGKLRNERHLLILDNLESIQGGYFAVKNTLSPDEQAKLKDFLADLRGTDDVFQEQTIVLLGSRSAEEWLADTTFRKNLYDLGGLDAESATQFAEEILRQNEIPQSRKDEDFKKLLKLLAGFPLPMKVIFENLKRQSAAQILDALKAGDVDLNTGTAEEKTADILKCIEYSHSNIAPEKQELLLCLAPFTSVVNRMYFEKYIEELKKHDALAHLRHELWDEVFTESAGRGLMSQHEELPVYHLQPILPYFLKTEWQKSERSDFKQAVQTAFLNHFTNVSDYINQLIRSNDSDTRSKGIFLTEVDFENIDSCLNYAFNSKSSFYGPYSLLVKYYKETKNSEARLNLGTKVLKEKEKYSSGFLTSINGTEFLTALDDIAYCHFELKNFDEAENFYEQALKLIDENQNLEKSHAELLKASIYQQIGIVAQGKFDLNKAENYYLRALATFTKYGAFSAQAKCFHQLGLMEEFRGNWQKAEEYYQVALNTKIKINERLEQAYTYHHLGVVSGRQKNWSKAETYHQKELEIFTEFYQRFGQGMAYHELGVVAQAKFEWKKAEAYYVKALEIFIEFKDYNNQGNSYHELGCLAQIQYEWKKAEAYFRKAIDVFQQSNDFHSSAKSLGQLGFLKQEQEKFNEAQNYFLKALEVFKDFDDEQNLNFTLSNVRDLWRRSGDDNFLLKVGGVLGVSEAQVRELFEKELDKNVNEEGNIE